jgi:hypothetical protein
MIPRDDMFPGADRYPPPDARTDEQFIDDLLDALDERRRLDALDRDEAEQERGR